MALLSVSNLEKYFGSELLFKNISFEVQANDRIGLVGVNGTGKTTLFKLLTGEMSLDGGEIFLTKNTQIGYMEQHVCRNLNETAYDEVLSVFSHLIKLEEELESLNIKISKQMGDVIQLVERQAQAHDAFVDQGGLTYKSRTRSALLGLGFDDQQMALPIGALSGGQKAKLQLAKMLLSGANLLLLDEPTNHLDIPSVEWLEEYLKGYHGAYLVISHDRYFLDKVTNRTMEIENHKLTVYKGNYSVFLAQKAENRLAAQRQYDNTKKEITRLEGVAAQQRQWNREKNIKTAESKLKMIERLEKNLEKPEQEPEEIHFHFDIRQTGGNDVLDVEDLALSFDHKTLFQNINLRVRKGERIFLLGPNGCGKTSLFKTLLHHYQPDAGHIKFGAGIDVGYYDQIQAGLDNNKTVIEEIWDQYPQLTQTQIRSALAIFLFHGDDVFKLVSALSGGERAKVLLLQLMMSKANFLLLDEPTNHLDIASREALENALASYEGTLLIISHDRYLINKTADRIYYLEEQGAKEYVGNYDAYLEQIQKVEPSEHTCQEKAAIKPPNEYKLRKERESELRKLRTRLKKSEDEIERLDQELQKKTDLLSQPEIASDYEKAMELTEEIATLKACQDEQYELWEKISEELEEKQNSTGA